MKFFSTDTYVEQMEGKKFFFGFLNVEQQKSGFCLLASNLGNMTASFYLNGMSVLAVQTPICLLGRLQIKSDIIENQFPDKAVSYIGPIKEGKRNSIGIQKDLHGRMEINQYDNTANTVLRHIYIQTAEQQEIRFLDFYQPPRLSERFAELFPQNVIYRIEFQEGMCKKVVETNEDLIENGECVDTFENGLVVKTLKNLGQVLQVLEIVQPGSQDHFYFDKLAADNLNYEGSIAYKDGSVFTGLIHPCKPYPLIGKTTTTEGEILDVNTTLMQQADTFHQLLNVFPSSDSPVTEQNTAENSVLFTFVNNKTQKKNGYAIKVYSDLSDMNQTHKADFMIYADDVIIQKITLEDAQLGLERFVEDQKQGYTIGPYCLDTKQFYGIIVKKVEKSYNQITFEGRQIVSHVTGGPQKNQITRFLEKYSRIRRSSTFSFFPKGAVYRAEIISGDGTQYVGDSNEQGLRHGYGVERKRNGECHHAIYDNGLLVREIEAVTAKQNRIKYEEKICDSIYEGTIQFQNGTFFDGTIDSRHMLPLQGIFKNQFGNAYDTDFVAGEINNSTRRPQPEKRYKVCGLRYREGEKV